MAFKPRIDKVMQYFAPPNIGELLVLHANGLIEKHQLHPDDSMCDLREKVRLQYKIDSYGILVSRNGTFELLYDLNGEGHNVAMTKIARLMFGIESVEGVCIIYCARDVNDRQS